MSGSSTLVVEVERIGPVAACDLEDVAKSGARHQRRAHALALDVDRVDDEGRARGSRARRLPAASAALQEAVENPGAEAVVESSGSSCREHVVGFVVEGDEVGERSADVDGDEVSTFRSVSRAFSGGRHAFPPRLPLH